MPLHKITRIIILIFTNKEKNKHICLKNDKVFSTREKINMKWIYLNILFISDILMKKQTKNKLRFLCPFSSWNSAKNIHNFTVYTCTPKLMTMFKIMYVSLN